MSYSVSHVVEGGGWSACSEVWPWWCCQNQTLLWNSWPGKAKITVRPMLLNASHIPSLPIHHTHTKQTRQ